MKETEPIGVFPAELNFDRPLSNLQYAVDCLPEIKGRSRRPKSQLQALKKKLMQMSVEDLKKLKMKPALQKDLLYLVTDRANVALQQRIAAVALGCMSTLQMPVLRNLLVYLWQHPELIGAVERKFSKTPPDEKQPTWLRLYWKKLLRSQNMVNEFIGILQQEKINLTKVISFLQLPPGTPLSEKVLETYWQTMSDEFLHSHKFADCLWFIEKSGYSIKVRYALLQWFFQKFAGQATALQDVASGTAIRAVYDLALSIWGKPPLGRWYSLPSNACRVALWLWNWQQLTQCVKGPQKKLEWWSRWVKSIDNVGIHQATGIIVVTLGEWFAIESFHQPNTLRLIAADRFKVMWRVKRYQKPPLQLPNADMELFRAEKDWPSKFDAVFRRRLNAEPEDWKW